MGGTLGGGWGFWNGLCCSLASFVFPLDINDWKLFAGRYDSFQPLFSLPPSGFFSSVDWSCGTRGGVIYKIQSGNLNLARVPSSPPPPAGVYARSAFPPHLSFLFHSQRLEAIRGPRSFQPLFSRPPQKASEKNAARNLDD